MNDYEKSFFEEIKEDLPDGMDFEEFLDELEEYSEFKANKFQEILDKHLEDELEERK